MYLACDWNACLCDCDMVPASTSCFGLGPCFVSAVGLLVVQLNLIRALFPRDYTRDVTPDRHIHTNDAGAQPLELIAKQLEQTRPLLDLDLRPWSALTCRITCR